MGLNDLSTKPVKDEVDFHNLPEQFGGSTPPLPPGSYRFKLSKLGPDNFDKAESAEYKDRMKVLFNDAAPLEVVQSLGNKHNGEPFKTQLSNIPRARNKDRTVFASDVDYLLQALGVKERPKSARGYADVLMAKSLEGAEFTADIEWSWHSNENKAARFPQEGGRLEEVAGEDGQPLKGSGERWYQKDVPKQEDGTFPLYVTDANGASVRAFGNLTRFRA